MAYSRKQAQINNDTTHFMVVPRLDICAHPTIQILDLIFDKEQWRVINFYHDVLDNTCLQKILEIDIDAVVPTLIIGDFNTHSREWSPMDIPQSCWAGQLEEWAARNLLMLANNPGEITRRGADHEQDSVIDLAWYNEAAIQAATFTGLSVDWEGSLGSDHAMLHIMGQTCKESRNQNLETNLVFLIDPERSKEWICTFKLKSSAHCFQTNPTAEEIEEAAEAYMMDIH